MYRLYEGYAHDAGFGEYALPPKDTARHDDPLPEDADPEYILAEVGRSLKSVADGSVVEDAPDDEARIQRNPGTVALRCWRMWLADRATNPDDGHLYVAWIVEQ